ncbi:TPA: hypothetical protein ACKOQA_001373 [Clostridioides difficile]|uniref:hypothetical protein n=3 Tax=Clostridioides difficile TaxID=1496 RepID=UPI001F20EF85|nr:hypothetical protein [Clostridioides difficile]MCR1521550.1 hypothetical protein [Clostridioides difficile]
MRYYERTTEMKKRRGFYSETDLYQYQQSFRYTGDDWNYVGTFERSNIKDIFIEKNVGRYLLTRNVYRTSYSDNRKETVTDLEMKQLLNITFIKDPIINLTLSNISKGCTIDYNIVDNEPTEKFIVTEKLNNTVIATKPNSVGGNYSITLTDEQILPLQVNSQNNIIIEISTEQGGLIIRKTVTFTRTKNKPIISINSYNSNSAKFIVSDLDNNLSKIEWYLDDLLKETITTDLTTEKTINYELADNAIHTLKIVATDAENATVEKVLSISKEIMPLQEDATLQDISTKLIEIGEGFKNGKTSIINTLSLKNIEANLNNTLVELSEKIKTSFNSSDASVQELQNIITQKNNTISQLNTQLGQRKRWAKGTFDQSKITGRSTTIPMNLSFTPSIIFVSCGINFSFAYASARSCNLKFFTNLMKANPTTSTIDDENFNGVVFATVKEINKSSFVLYLKGFSYNGSDAEVSPLAGTTFNWTAIE